MDNTRQDANRVMALLEPDGHLTWVGTSAPRNEPSTRWSGGRPGRLHQRRALHGRARHRRVRRPAGPLDRRPEWFWDAVVELPRHPVRRRRTTQVLDTSDGIPWATLVHRRHAQPGRRLRRPLGRRDARRRRPSCWEGEDGEVRALDLRRAAPPGRRPGRAAAASGASARATPSASSCRWSPRRRGRVHGGRQARRDLPADLLRLRRRGHRRAPGRRRRQGARHRRRLPAAGPVGADARHRRRRGRPRSARSRRSSSCPGSAGWRLDAATVGGVATSPCPARDAGRPSRSPTVPVDSEHPLFIAYTSGTTGRPKGSVHVHGGFTVKVAEEVAFQFDCRPGDRLFWFADFGWIMGPWEIIGALANGATVCLYEGAPDFPEPDRLWAYVERHEVTDPRHQPDADPGADGPRRRARSGATTCRRCASSAPPASRGTRTRGAGTSRWSAAAAARSSTSPAAPRSAPASCRPTPSRTITPMTPRRPGAGHGRRRVRRRRPAGAGRGRRAGVHQAVAGHDPGPVARTRSATSRRTGAAGPTCGSTATGRRSRTASGSCTAAATTRSRSPASGSARPRSSPRWCRTPRSPRPRPSACPTR